MLKILGEIGTVDNNEYGVDGVPRARAHLSNPPAQPHHHQHHHETQAVLKMLGEIGTVDNIPKFIARAKDKSDPFRRVHMPCAQQ